MSNKFHEICIYFGWVFCIIITFIALMEKDFELLLFVGAVVVSITIIACINMKKFSKVKNLNEENSLKIYSKYKKCMVANTQYKKNLQDYSEIISRDILGIKFYIITCEGENPITNKITQFQSELISFNPIEIIEKNSIVTFPVLIDHKNPKRYKVILDELYELNREMQINKKTH